MCFSRPGLFGHQKVILQVLNNMLGTIIVDTISWLLYLPKASDNCLTKCPKLRDGGLGGGGYVYVYMYRTRYSCITVRCTTTDKIREKILNRNNSRIFKKKNWKTFYSCLVGTIKVVRSKIQRRQQIWWNCAFKAKKRIAFRTEPEVTGLNELLNKETISILTKIPLSRSRQLNSYTLL